MTLNGSKPLWATTALLIGLLGWAGNKAYEHLVNDYMRTTNIEKKLAVLEEKVSWIQDYLLNIQPHSEKKN